MIPCCAHPGCPAAPDWRFIEAWPGVGISAMVNYTFACSGHLGGLIAPGATEAHVFRLPGSTA